MVWTAFFEYTPTLQQATIDCMHDTNANKKNKELLNHKKNDEYMRRENNKKNSFKNGNKTKKNKTEKRRENLNRSVFSCSEIPVHTENDMQEFSCKQKTLFAAHQMK